MKRLLVSLLALVGLGANTQAEAQAGTSSVMADMRARALSVKLQDLGLSPKTYPHGVWGVLMETGLANGDAYSLVVLADGTTSLYFSTGGGIIGAGEQTAVRQAAGAMLASANRLRSEAKVATSTPLPTAGQVVFYLLSDAGTLTASGAESALGGGKERLSPLFFSGHGVIAEVRKTEEARKSGR
jgi:hypothetical protein